jgi:hypothetical protein
VHRDVRWT